MEIEVRRTGGLGRQAGWALEHANRRLKRLLAESPLENAALKDLLGKKRLKPAARRGAVIQVIEGHGLSQRHACELVGLDRSTLRYRCRRADDSALRQRLREAPLFAQTISFFSANALKLPSLIWTNHYCLLATLWYRLMPRSAKLQP
jgi:hypothetical protein